jgi:hypothetical protein
MGLNEIDVRRIIWTFVQAFVGTFLVTVAGIAASPSFDAAKALVISAVAAALAAAISAVKNLLLADTSTLK